MSSDSDTFYYDKEKVNQIKPLMDDVTDVELIFKALADSTRLKLPMHSH